MKFVSLYVVAVKPSEQSWLSEPKIAFTNSQSPNETKVLV